MEKVPVPMTRKHSGDAIPSKAIYSLVPGSPCRERYPPEFSPSRDPTFTAYQRKPALVKKHSKSHRTPRARESALDWVVKKSLSEPMAFPGDQKDEGT